LVLDVQDGATAKVAVAVVTAVRPRVLHPTHFPLGSGAAAGTGGATKITNPGRTTSEQRYQQNTQPLKISKSSTNGLLIHSPQKKRTK